MIMKDKKLLPFKEYISSIENDENRNRLVELLEFVAEKFPQLETALKWNQPMFLDHGTYIIGFSTTKNHINVAPERATMIEFADVIKSRDVGSTKMLIQMKWNKPVDYDLLEEIIVHNITEKKDITSFWR